MSGDHNQNQTTSGWRKRQIVLDKKAENARELGLDYEPDKTVIEMAEEAGLMGKPVFRDGLERFAALVRADEREACAKVCEDLDAWVMDDPGSTAAKAIRARGDSR